jgi:hypothetical protein
MAAMLARRGCLPRSKGGQNAYNLKWDWGANVALGRNGLTSGEIPVCRDSDAGPGGGRDSMTSPPSSVTLAARASRRLGDARAATDS